MPWVDIGEHFPVHNPIIGAALMTNAIDNFSTEKPLKKMHVK